MPIAYRIVVVLVTLVTLGLAFEGGMLVYRFASRPVGHLHSVVRRQGILGQADQVPAGGVVILGDSIVEFRFLDTDVATLCEAGNRALKTRIETAFGCRSS